MLSLLSGCKKPVEEVPAIEPGGLVLRAGRFTAAPDGRSREVWGYNGRLPGPLLRTSEAVLDPTIGPPVDREAFEDRAESDCLRLSERNIH
jgi:hypothetical protein